MVIMMAVTVTVAMIMIVIAIVAASLFIIRNNPLIPGILPPRGTASVRHKKERHVVTAIIVRTPGVGLPPSGSEKLPRKPERAKNQEQRHNEKTQIRRHGR